MISNKQNSYHYSFWVLNTLISSLFVYKILKTRTIYLFLEWGSVECTLNKIWLTSLQILSYLDESDCVWNVLFTIVYNTMLFVE